LNVVAKIPKKWNNIQALHIKTHNSISLPLYNSLPDQPTKITPDLMEVEEKGKAKDYSEKEEIEEEIEEENQDMDDEIDSEEEEEEVIEEDDEISSPKPKTKSNAVSTKKITKPNVQQKLVVPPLATKSAQTKPQSKKRDLSSITKNIETQVKPADKRKSTSSTASKKKTKNRFLMIYVFTYHNISLVML